MINWNKEYIDELEYFLVNFNDEDYLKFCIFYCKYEFSKDRMQIELLEKYLKKEVCPGVVLEKECHWFMTDYFIRQVLFRTENPVYLCFDKSVKYMEIAKTYLAKTTYNNKFWNNFIND